LKNAGVTFRVKTEEKYTVLLIYPKGKILFEHPGFEGRGD
jgi:hypothetical protein